MANQPLGNFNQLPPLPAPTPFGPGRPSDGASPAKLVGIGFGATVLLAIVVIGLSVALKRSSAPSMADRGVSVPVGAEADDGLQSVGAPATVGNPAARGSSSASVAPTSGRRSTTGTAAAPAGTGKATVQRGAPRSVSADGQRPLRYDWATGYEYRCFFTIEVEVGDAEQQTHGMTTYRPTDIDPATVGGEETEGEGTGTAFAVHPDGLFVTCAHVVRGSTKIDVHLGDVVYAGKAVVLDTRSDLAIVRIDIDEKIPFLPLHDSDRVELAQDVRVVGYPLSDVLGESVKISRGTIAGVVEREGGNRFQVDASINPGNSGGPLIDEQGRVIGIASELLVSESIDAVGFVVPSNEAARLLERREIAVTRQQDGEDLPGPELARRVTPAVALLKVQYGPGGFGMAEQRVVKYSGNYSTEMESGSPFGGYGMGPSSSKNDSGTMLVDAYGEIAAHDGVTSAPYPFAAIGTIGIESLPADGRSSWSSTRVTMLVQSVEQGPSRGRYPGGIRPPPMIRPPRYGSPYGGIFGRPSPTVVVCIPAIEEIHYKLGAESADGTLEIHKQYELTALAGEGDKPRLSVTTQGTIIWDRAQGMPREAKFEGTMSLNNEQLSVQLPVTVSYSLERLSDAEVKARMEAFREEQIEAGRARSQKAREETNAAAAEAALSGEENVAEANATIGDQHLSKRGLSAFRPNGSEEGAKPKE